VATQTEDSGLEDARQHLTALRDVEWLLALDDLWTSYISVGRQAPTGARADFPALVRLAGDMDRALEEAPRAAGLVASSLDAMDDDAVGSALDSLREAVPETATVLDWLSDSVEVTPRMTLIAACTWVTEETETERAILHEKTAILERGELPDPDMRPIFRCIGSLVGMGAGIAIAAAGTVSVLGAPAVIALGSAGYVYGIAETWKKTRCGEVVRGATDALARLRPGPAGPS
jgi:hypothetical protein